MYLLAIALLGCADKPPPLAAIELRTDLVVGLEPDGGLAFCSEWNDSLDRWEAPCHGEPPVLDGPFTAFDVQSTDNDMQVCALDEAGSVVCQECLNDAATPRRDLPDGPWAQVAAGVSGPLLLGVDGRITAVGRETELDTALTYQHVDHYTLRWYGYVSGRYDVDCGITPSGLSCNTLSIDGDFAHVGVHDDVACASGGAEGARCWGLWIESDDGFNFSLTMTELELPALTGGQIDFFTTSQEMQLCELDDAGTLRCWVRDSEFSWSAHEVPEGPFTTFSVRGSPRAGCGVTADQSVECWADPLRACVWDTEQPPRW